MSRRRDDSGAVAIETALITGLLILIVMGAFEYGMAFRSWFGLAAASREGARVGASVGPVTDADCAILEATAAALASTSENEVVQIEIYKHDPVSGGPSGQFNRYRAFDPDTDDPAFLRCSTWFEAAYGWSETSRDNTGDDRDWLGVEVTYEHFWITGFLWWSGSVQWTNSSVMRLEPVNYGAPPPP